MEYLFKCSKNTGKNLEASYIALWKINRNEQNDFETLVLFKDDIINQWHNAKSLKFAELSLIALNN